MGRVVGISVGMAVVIAGLVAGNHGPLLIGFVILLASLVGRRSTGSSGSSSGRVIATALGGFLLLSGFALQSVFLVVVGFVVVVFTVAGMSQTARRFGLSDYTAPKPEIDCQTLRPLPQTPSSHEPGPYTVVLASAGGNKIGVIKVVRELTGLGLKEAKDLVDSAPSVVLRGISPSEANDAYVRLRTAGAEVSLSERKQEPASATGSAAPSSQTATFRVMLLSPGPHKIEVIKAVREATELGLAEAVRLVEHTPAVVRDGLSGEDADAIAEVLGAVGATVEVVKPGMVQPRPTSPAVPTVAPVSPAASEPTVSPPAQPPVVTPAPPPPVPPPVPAPRPAAAPAPVQVGKVDLVLKSGGRRTMQVRQVLKNQFGLDLLQAFNAVEKAPSVVKSGIPRGDAERLKVVLEAEGAEMEIRTAGEEAHGA